MKLTIYRKLLLSYLAMAFLTVLASAYAIFSLQQLNDLAYRIINDDFAVVDRSKSLLDGVLLLNRQERPDPGKARSVFLSLIQRYPQSRWRPAAEVFIRLIDERDAFGEMSRLGQSVVRQDRDGAVEGAAGERPTEEGDPGTDGKAPVGDGGARAGE